MRKRTFALALFILALSLAPAAFADTLSFSITNPVQAGRPGTTLTYFASVSAPLSNSAAIFLNGDSFSLSGGTLTLDDSGFLNNFPLSLNPGLGYSGALFTISVPLNAKIGLYTGNFSILGGGNGAALNVLATSAFSAQVTPEPSSVTPEPSSLLLLGTGAFGLTGLFRRRLFA